MTLPPGNHLELPKLCIEPCSMNSNPHTPPFELVLNYSSIASSPTYQLLYGEACELSGENCTRLYGYLLLRLSGVVSFTRFSDRLVAPRSAADLSTIYYPYRKSTDCIGPNPLRLYTSLTISELHQPYLEFYDLIRKPRRLCLSKTGRA